MKLRVSSLFLIVFILMTPVFAISLTIKEPKGENYYVYTIDNYDKINSFLQNLTKDNYTFYIISENTYYSTGLPPSFIMDSGGIRDPQKILNRIHIAKLLYVLAMQKNNISNRIYMKFTDTNVGISTSKIITLHTTRFVVIKYNGTIYSSFSLGLIHVRNIQINGIDVLNVSDVFENLTKEDKLMINNLSVDVIINKVPNCRMFIANRLINGVPITFYTIRTLDYSHYYPINPRDFLSPKQPKRVSSNTGFHFDELTKDYLVKMDYVLYSDEHFSLPAGKVMIGNYVYIITPTKITNVLGVYTSNNYRVGDVVLVKKNKDNTIIIVKISERMMMVPVFVRTDKGSIFLGLI